jgi:hypothetical protein
MRQTREDRPHPQTQIPPLNAIDARNAQIDPFKEVALVPAAENPYSTPTRGIEVS